MRIPLATVTLTALLCAPSIHAQNTRNTPGDARAHFERGVQLIQAARWRDAITELEAARALHATASVMYNLGLAHRAVGEDRASIDAFREFLRLAGSTIDAARQREVDDFVSELLAALARVHLDVTPTDAVVTVDDGRVAPGDVDLDPGTHRIHVTLAGFAEQTREVSLRAGERSALRFNLSAADVRAYLHVESNVETAVVRVDEHDVGNGTVDVRLDPGRHTVDIVAVGRVPYHRLLVIDADEHVRIPVNLAVPSRTHGGLVAGIVVGAAVLVGAGVTAICFATLSHTEDPYVGGLGVTTAALRVGP